MAALRTPLSRGSVKTHRHQQGVTLLVVMVMLIVIGLVSASAMRQAANSDLISNNARLEHLAKQDAETALRRAEELIRNATTLPTLQIQPADAANPAWRNFANWHGTGSHAVSLSAADYRSPEQTTTGTNQPPQYLIEYSPLGNTVYIITARGFSPDFREDENGRTLSGSVVWLQSTLSTQ